jgi:Zn-dependent peptidase ImmA (M78 family)/transcriptional regulator with XRE-family HTH domain
MSAIQPQILTWARETAGLSLEDAAHALGLKEARGKAGVDRLAALEAGTDEPARPLLLKMAKTYRRPLLVFYLGAPPQIGDRGQDFRTLPGPERYNPDLDALIRDIKGRQGLIRSMLEDNEATPLDFIGSAKTSMPATILAKRVAERLQFSLNEFRATKTPDEAFAYLRARIEATGVFVLLLGNLGSHHTNIPVEIFRGFALADPIAPMIVINDQDARSAWSFTALHELVHLWLGDTGVSADANSAIEQYCNDVAGEILLPAAELTAFPKVIILEKAVPEISTFAESRRVSRAMVAYKLLRAGIITKPLWSQLNEHFRKEWLLYKQRQADKQKQSESGPSYYVVRRHRVGAALLGLVRRSLDEGNITYTKASRVLGVKPRNVEPLLYSGAMRGNR